MGKSYNRTTTHREKLQRILVKTTKLKALNINTHNVVFSNDEF